MLAASDAPPPMGPIARLDCPASLNPLRMALRFERITDIQDEEMRALVSRGTQHRVNFEWNAQTSELSYRTGAMDSGPTLADCRSD